MAQMTIAEKAGQLLHSSLGLDPASPALQAALKAGAVGAMTIEGQHNNGSTCGVACRIARVRELQLSFLSLSFVGGKWAVGRLSNNDSMGSNEHNS